MTMPIELETTPHDSKVATKGRVLIVDDEVRLLRAYTRLLRASGYDVTAMSEGEQAVRCFSEHGADVIITDLAMPGMNGLQVLRAVREIDPDVPVILITAAATTESAVRAMEYGALRYLLKPVAREALERALEDAQHLRKMARLKHEAEALFQDFHKQQGDRAHLEAALTRAIGGVRMFYQPIVRWSERRVFGYEALVRSNEPALPHPGALFDAAEQLSRVEELGRRIRAEVPKGVAEGPAPADSAIFVNLHTRDLNDDHLFDPASPLSRISHRVVLEITERASLHDVGDVHARIASLRQMGFRIAIDDIGAGYAGLTSFALLEPDVVKVDMALVRDVHKTPTKQKLIRSLVTLCADLNITLIAEGVENADERDTLVQLGCDFLQGYHFAKPAPAFAQLKL